jgi:hypothetical protein
VQRSSLLVGMARFLFFYVEAVTIYSVMDMIFVLCSNCVGQCNTAWPLRHDGYAPRWI